DDANWLLIKRTDRGASPLKPHDRSVLTGRTMAQIARGEQAVSEDVQNDEDAKGARGDGAPEADGSDANAAATVAATADLGAIEGAKRAKPPAEPGLQLARLADEAPTGDDWIHEIKYDGYRVLAHVENGEG